VRGLAFVCTIVVFLFNLFSFFALFQTTTSADTPLLFRAVFCLLVYCVAVIVYFYV